MPKTIKNGAETKHLNSTRTARPPRAWQFESNSNATEKKIVQFVRLFVMLVTFEFFSNFSSRRRDRFGPKIVKFRAILAIFRPFEDFRNGAETKHLTSIRAARPPKGPCSSTRIQMLQSSSFSFHFRFPSNFKWSSNYSGSSSDIQNYVISIQRY